MALDEGSHYIRIALLTRIDQGSPSQLQEGGGERVTSICLGCTSFVPILINIRTTCTVHESGEFPDNKYVGVHYVNIHT